MTAGYETIKVRGFLALDKGAWYERALEAHGFTAGEAENIFSEAITSPGVIAQIDAAEARGTRVLLVPVEGGGGHHGAMLAVYARLRAFSAAGGVVVTVLAGPKIASSLPFVALAGDHVLAVPEAVLMFHSAKGTPRDEAQAAADQAAILADRTVLPQDAIHAILSYRGKSPAGRWWVAPVSGGNLLGAGLADLAVQDLESARGFARFIASVLEEGAGALPKRDAPGGKLWAARCGLQRSFKVRPAPPDAQPEEGRGICTSTVTDVELAPDAVTTTKITDDAVTTPKIVAGAITADKIAAGQIKTSNYAEDEAGNPTAGAKLDHLGTALKVAPGNLQIGDELLADMALARRVLAVHSPAAGSVNVILNRGWLSGSRQAYGGANLPAYAVRCRLSPAVSTSDDWVWTVSPYVYDGGATWSWRPVILGALTFDGTDVWVGLQNGNGAWQDPNSSDGWGFVLTGFKWW